MVRRGRFVAAMIGLLATLHCLQSVAVEPIDVQITSHLGDHQTFTDGDQVSFLLSLQRDAYVYLFYRDANQNLIQLLPNPQNPDHAYRTGLFMPIPKLGHPFRFVIREPFGEETVFAVASDNGEIELPGRWLDNRLKLLDAPIDQVVSQIRDASFGAFGEARFRLRTRAASS